MNLAAADKSGQEGVISLHLVLRVGLSSKVVFLRSLSDKMSMSNRTNRILGLVQSRNNIENNTDGLANKENNCNISNEAKPSTSQQNILKRTQEVNLKNSQTNSNISDEISEPFSDDSLHDRTYAPSSTDYESESEADSEVESAEDVDSQEEIEGTVLENQEISNVDQNEWGPIKAGECEFDLIPEDCTLAPHIYAKEVKHPIDIFQFFVTNDLLDIIVTETNIYALQQINVGHKNKSRMKSWNNTNRDEIRKFFGILLAMGLTSVPALNLYWSKDPMFHNQFISSRMSRDRFILLLKFIHFSNNETADPDNRLSKIENILSIIINNFQSTLQPGRVVVIDESMVPFRGRVIFRQYLPNKTHKYGIKLYKLCTPGGYTCNIKVYTGKEAQSESLGHSLKIVHKLLEILDLEGRILYADNFYSSIDLVRQLYELKMLYCGTLRSNRKGIPPIFNNKKGKKMKKNEIIGKQNDIVKIIKWVDKRPVLMISSDPSHDASLISTGNTKIFNVEQNT